MKVFIVVALFAFVAVKLSHAAPTPDEEKKEEAVPAVTIVADTAAPAAAPAAVAEVKVEHLVTDGPFVTTIKTEGVAQAV